MTVWNSKAKYIVLNEVNIVSQAIRRSSGRYHSRTHHQTNLSGDDYDDLIPHMKGFVDLKQVIAAIQNLSNLEPFRFVQPFLEVIRADDVNGPITSLALSSMMKTRRPLRSCSGTSTAEKRVSPQVGVYQVGRAGKRMDVTQRMGEEKCTPVRVARSAKTRRRKSKQGRVNESMWTGFL